MKTIGQILRPWRSWSSLQALDESRAQEALACYTFMGWVSPPGGGELLRNLRDSFAAARSFAEASDFRRARSRLGRTGPQWTQRQIQRTGCFLLVAHGSLAACSVIASAQAQGWRLIIEDGPFARNFIAPPDACHRAGMELRPGHQLPARQREIRRTPGLGASLFVTFCDRPGWGGGDDIEAEVAGGRYHLSALDALLMAADFDGVFMLGRELQPVAVAAAHVDWATGRISGETLFHYTELCGRALSEIITFAPGHYLGVPQLVTRNVRYRMMAVAGKIARIKSLLHYCQTAGLPLPEHSYARLRLMLDGTHADENARSRPD